VIPITAREHIEDHSKVIDVMASASKEIIDEFLFEEN
jgi:hypothetical protein